MKRGGFTEWYEKNGRVCEEIVAGDAEWRAYYEGEGGEDRNENFRGPDAPSEYTSLITQLLITAWRFMVLLSFVIPISLRVNLDLAKMIHSHQIQSDGKIAGTLVRNSQIPEELGVIDYILSDKTGTLTKNEMVFQKLRVPVGEYGIEDRQKIQTACKRVMEAEQERSPFYPFLPPQLAALYGLLFAVPFPRLTWFTFPLFPWFTCIVKYLPMRLSIPQVYSFIVNSAHASFSHASFPFLCSFCFSG